MKIIILLTTLLASAAASDNLHGHYLSSMNKGPYVMEGMGCELYDGDGKLDEVFMDDGVKPVVSKKFCKCKAKVDPPKDGRDVVFTYDHLMCNCYDKKGNTLIETEDFQETVLACGQAMLICFAPDEE